MLRAAALAALFAAASAQRVAPAPPAVPQAKTGGDCETFCCAQTTRETCCGAQFVTGAADACPFGPDSGFCSWTGDNTCQRNCFERPGPCAEIELCFNWTTDTAQADLDALGAQMATEAVWLVGSNADTIVHVSSKYNATLDLLFVTLRCPEGGCGTFEEIAAALCFAGAVVPNTGGHAVRQAVDGKCLKEGPGGPTVEYPKADLAGHQPVQVTARSCDDCVPSVNVTVGTQESMAMTMEMVVGKTISPAFLDAPPLNELCHIPELFQGLYHFRLNHSAASGTVFEINCPSDCLACDVYLSHYHDVPCSSDTNGGFPALLPADGWQAASCGPSLCGDAGRFGMVTYRRQIAGGSSVSTPPVATDCLKYYAIFAGPGVNCEANELQDETLCAKAGGLCVWKDGECKTEYCPRITPGSPSPGPVGQGEPHVCVPAPGLEC